jgi:hypothetical protein
LAVTDYVLIDRYVVVGLIWWLASAQYVCRQKVDVNKEGRDGCKQRGKEGKEGGCMSTTPSTSIKVCITTMHRRSSHAMMNRVVVTTINPTRDERVLLLIIIITTRQ